VFPSVLDGIEDVGEVPGRVGGAHFRHAIRLSDTALWGGRRLGVSALVGFDLVDLISGDPLNGFFAPPELIDAVLELDIIQFELLHSALVAEVDFIPGHLRSSRKTALFQQAYGIRPPSWPVSNRYPAAVRRRPVQLDTDF
jgi:hypothetical protein